MTPAHAVAFLRSKLKVDPPKTAAATVFEFGAASLVVTRLPLLFIETNAMSSLSGGLSHSQSYPELGCKYLTACVHTFVA